MNRDLPQPPGSRPGPVSAPLDAEERALAEQLAHMGTSGGPSPALDARILGAARAALADSAAPARRRPRWPAPLALAASVVFAVGIAWQLREPEPATSVEIAADAPASVQAHEAPPTTPSAEPQPAAAVAAPERDTTTRRQRSDAAAAAARKSTPPPPAPPPPSPPASAPKVVLPAPPAPPPPSRKAAPAADRATQAPLRAESHIASTAAIVAQDAEAAREVAEARTTDHMVAAAPAVSLAQAEAVAEDARLTAAAWLARIADRRDRGELQLARASLQRFIEQHPDAQVPADLQPLLEE